MSVEWKVAEWDLWRVQRKAAEKVELLVAQKES